MIGNVWKCQVCWGKKDVIVSRKRTPTWMFLNSIKCHAHFCLQCALTTGQLYLCTVRQHFFFLGRGVGGSQQMAASDLERPWWAERFAERTDDLHSPVRPACHWLVDAHQQRGVSVWDTPPLATCSCMPPGLSSNAACFSSGRWLDVFHSFCVKPAEHLKLKHLLDLATD